MNPDDLVELLLEEIPEARPTYVREKRRFQGPSGEVEVTPSYAFGVTVVAFIQSLIEEPIGGEAERVLENVFGFLERLMEDENPSTRGAVEIEVCEALLDKPTWLKVKDRMGPQTRAAAEFMRAGPQPTG